MRHRAGHVTVSGRHGIGLAKSVSAGLWGLQPLFGLRCRCSISGSGTREVVVGQLTPVHASLIWEMLPVVVQLESLTIRSVRGMPAVRAVQDTLARLPGCRIQLFHVQSLISVPDMRPITTLLRQERLRISDSLALNLTGNLLVDDDHEGSRLLCMLAKAVQAQSAPTKLLTFGS